MPIIFVLNFLNGLHEFSLYKIYIKFCTKNGSTVSYENFHKYQTKKLNLPLLFSGDCFLIIFLEILYVISDGPNTKKAIIIIGWKVGMWIVMTAAKNVYINLNKNYQWLAMEFWLIYVFFDKYYLVHVLVQRLSLT